MKTSNGILLSGLTVITWIIFARSLPAAEAVQLAARPFPLSAVRLLDGPFAEAQQRNRDVLLQLDPERLLHMFRVTAGLPSQAEPYGGWEAPQIEVRGHSLGHYLSACALTYAATEDAQFKDRADRIVTALAECQNALPQQGAHPGYLSAFAESFIDRVEAGQPVWAPWYVLHKIMAGLLDAHQYCDNQQALDVLVKMTAWVQFRMDRLSTEQQQAMLKNEFGGMNEVLANLYAVTGNPDHLRMAKVFDHQFVFDPLAQGEDRLDGLHANTQVPKAIGAAREYEVTGDSRYLDIAKFFWERVALHRSYAIGGHSDREHFFPPAEFSKHLSAETTETCNTYNMLKLTRHLFAVDPSATTMDFYERALYNHILASQDPKTGMFVYLMPLKPGHFKSYSTLDNSFWCCVGTGLENHAKYADTIFSHSDDSLYVNLFIPAELQWPEKGLQVRQETRFPETDSIQLRFQVKEPLELALKIRRPGWATQDIEVAVNGQPEKISSPPGSYFTIRRTWRTGDVVTWRMPLSLRIETLPQADHVIAFLYGPLVLAGDLGTEGLEALDLYTRNQTDLVAVPGPRAEIPALVGDCSQLLQHLHPVPDKPLEFRTEGVGRPHDVTLQPFYRIHHRRYSVYWECYSEDDWKALSAERAAAEAKRLELERRTVDSVNIGQSDSEQAHQLQGEHTLSGPFAGRGWRHADDGGWFSYQMKVLPDQPMTVMCTYWGSDAGNREFDVLVNDTKIAAQRLTAAQPGEFFDVVYDIPASCTSGRTSITLRFQAHPGATAGGVFGCRILK
ncbi:MAG: beta-L-arabinofuranosidase domain-containing protein [Pirellulaceae bacterium]